MKYDARSAFRRSWAGKVTQVIEHLPTNRRP
jgi:hypothetical protein